MNTIETLDAVYVPNSTRYAAGIVHGFTGSGLVIITWFLPVRNDAGDVELKSSETDIHYPGELEHRDWFLGHHAEWAAVKKSRP